MAQGALKKLEDHLRCSICLDTYTDPKHLQCFHIYCQKCLERLVVSNQNGLPTITCPGCYKLTSLPANGVEGLQTSLHALKLVEILNGGKKVEEADSLPTSSLGKGATPCNEHRDSEASLFCDKCEVPVCQACLAEAGKHRGHDCRTLSSAVEEFKREIASSLKPMQDQLASLSGALAKLNAESEKITQQQDVLEADIHSTIKGLKDTLVARETELMGQLDRLSQEKMDSLSAQRSKMKQAQAELSGGIEFVQENLAKGAQGERLSIKTTPLDPDFLKPNTEADLAFLAPEEAETMLACQNYGEVTSTGTPDPSRCHVIEDGVKIAPVGRWSTVAVRAINYRGEPCQEPIKSSECELIAEATGARSQYDLVRKDASDYIVTYRPSVQGRHLLHIKVAGQHVRGSPVKVAARTGAGAAGNVFDKKLGVPVVTSGLKNPWGVAINRWSGEVVVTEFDGGCVSVFSPGSQGKKLRSFGSQDSDQEEARLRDPRGVAIDNKGNIYVADAFNGRVVKFTEDGRFVGSVGGSGDDGGSGTDASSSHFRQLMGVAFNPSNNQLYVVEGSERVLILNLDLSLLGSFGERGRGEGQFSSPMGVACSTAGNVYVADSGNRRVQIFSAEGHFLSAFGGESENADDALSWPLGVVVDECGRVYVSDFRRCLVCHFSCEGRLLATFGRKGEARGQFMGCSGLALDHSDVLYVCDSSNGRLQAF